MEYKRNNRYFKDTGIYIIIALSGLAVVFIGLLLWFFAWDLWRFSTPIMIVGLIVAIFGFSMRIRDTDVDFDCEDKLRDQIEKVIKKFEVSENAQRYHKPVAFMGYQYGTDGGPLLKRGSDEKIRSSEFAGGAIVFSLKKIYFVKHTFSLIEPIDNEVYGDVTYTNITNANITEKTRRYTNKDKFEDVNNVVFSINTEKGSVFNIEIKSDAEVEQLVTDINRLVKQRKDEAAAQQ